MVGEDGFHFLDALEAPEAPQEARELPVTLLLDSRVVECEDVLY